MHDKIQDTTMKKSVRFDPYKEIFHYSEEPQSKSHFIRESHKRMKLERCLLRYPSSELNRLCQFIAVWRNRDISIVLGNLGRQPHLLNYYLDMCFHPEETIKVNCDYDLSIDYQTQDEKEADFLIRVEPYLGYTVRKDPSVKHLVVLTSHLSLCYWGGEIESDYLYLSNIDVSRPPDFNLQPAGLFKPPLFHQRVYGENLPDTVLLDVSDSKTAHEAYLRLLTGREIIGKRPFTIRATERDKAILKVNLKIWAEDTMKELIFLYNWLNNH